MAVLPGSDRPDTSGREEPSEDPGLVSDWPHVAQSPVLGWGLQALQKPEEMAAAGTCALAVCPEGARRAGGRTHAAPLRFPAAFSPTPSSSRSKNSVLWLKSEVLGFVNWLQTV